MRQYLIAAALCGLFCGALMVAAMAKGGVSADYFQRVSVTR